MGHDPDVPMPRSIRFSPFELDVRSGELRKHGIKIRLHEQPFRILLLLLERPGEVVPRDDIRLKLWPNNTVVEFDHSINAAIQRLRDALGDSADKPRYVETLARRGYRFIGALEPELEPAPSLPKPPPEAVHLDPLDPTNLSGVTFSHYRVIEKVGSGGMGVVYRADDLQLGRQVALKFLPLPASEASPQMLARFQREARAASALNHPNICTIHGVEEFAGQPLIVMEFLEGETLAQRLARGPLPLEKALPLAIQIASALAEAHQKRVVHRDLKPANVMLTKAGAKVLDFGLAKVESAVAVADVSSIQTSPAGTVLGSWHYMSPEQVQGKKADPRSDIFSFGCVLLEMLTGDRAFTGDSVADLMSAILTSDPLARITSLATTSPAMLRIVRHCLEKDPEERFQSARDLVFDLQSLSGTSNLPAAANPANAPRTLSWRLIAAAASLLLILSAGSWWAGRASRSFSAAKFQRLTFRRGYIQGARFTPGGQSVIYSAAWEGQPLELFSTQPGNLETRALGLPSTGLFAMAATGAVAVANNCRFLHTKSEGTLAVMPLGGGAPREILDHVMSADWARDGKRLAISSSPANGRTGRLEFPMGTVLLEATGTGWAGDIKLSPNEDRIAFLDHFYTGDDGSVAIVDLQGRKKTLTGNFTTLQGLAWSPNGHEIWFTGAREGGSERQLYAVTVAGALRVVTQVPGGLKLLDIAADGRLLLAREEIQSSVQFMGPGQSSPRNLSWLNWAFGPQLSADGKALLMLENGEGTGGKIATFVRGTDGSPAMRLGDWVGLSLSPDGKWIAATTDSTDPQAQQRRRDLTLVPVKAGKPLPIQNGALSLYGGIPTVLWSPDSRSIVYSATEPGHQVRTFVQDIAGGPPSPVTPEGFSAEILSPDGATLLVRDSQANPFLHPIQGGTPKRLSFLTPEHFALGFSADGHALYIASRGERPPRVRRVTLATGHIDIWREIPFFDPAGVTSFGSLRITPDGQSLAFTVTRVLSALYLVEGLR